LAEFTPTQLSAIIEQAPLAVAVVELDDAEACVFRLTNAEFRELFHIRGQGVISEPLNALFSESDARAISALLRSEVDRMSLQFDTSIGIADGGKLDCTVAARRLIGTEPKRVMITLESATARDPASREAQEHSEQQREDFIATLTHDLKTPIVGANMVLTALLDGSVGELQSAQAEIIGKLRTSNQALLKMIQNLLEVYKYESGTESLRFDGANLTEIVKFCVQDVHPLIENKHINLELFCAKPELLLICDEYAIKRVLINLLGNAVKFTPEGGKIMVHAIEDSNVARVIVKDTGRGISASDRQRLFQRFWQGEPGRRYAAGTGLGLYFCYNVVKAHGGKIVCDSEPGQGTTFTIDLPKHVYAQ
jgi:signal transduction histidine kinase